MQMEDMILVSTDDHIIEPANVFEGRMPAKYADDAPKFKQLADGTDKWEFAGKTTGPVGIGAVASWPKEEWGMDPVGHAEMRPGCYDIDERIRDMNANGVLGSLCFPTMTGFSGHYLANITDHDLARAAVSAYNDWHIDEWCAAAPGRFIPLAIAPVFDVDGMVAEIHRVAKKGCTAITLPEVPYLVDLPSWQSDYWNPVFKAVCEEDMVICMHIGIAINIIPNPDGLQWDRTIIMGAQMAAMTLNDLLTNGVFKRFPTLKVALSEGGIGWVPFYLDRADKSVLEQTWIPSAISSDKRLPSDVFYDNVLGCFITDKSALRIRDRVGINSIAWECDYPHSDSTWPQSPEKLWDELQSADCTAEEIDKITWQNASRFFRFDPFAFRSREDATVRGLRRLAQDVDTTITSKAEYRARYEQRHPELTPA